MADKPKRKPRNYKKDLQGMETLSGTFLQPNKPSPLRTHLQEYMKQYEHLPDAQYMAKQGAEANRWAAKNLFDGELPDDQELEGLKQYDLQERANLLKNMPEYANAPPEALMKAVMENNAGSNPIEGPMNAYAKLRKFDAPDIELPVPQHGGGGSTPRPPVKPKLAPENDDQKLSEAQLTMLYNIALGDKGMEPSMYEQEDSAKQPQAPAALPTPAPEAPASPEAAWVMQAAPPDMAAQVMNDPNRVEIEKQIRESLKKYSGGQ